jgi:peptide deformylase
LALLKIIAYGDPILRKQSAEIGEIDADLSRLIDDMLETLHVAGGIGLAAPQVTASKMLFVIDWSVLPDDAMSNEGIEIYINPKILIIGDSKETEAEGCLSLPEVTAEVLRSNEIQICYQNLEGKEISRTLTGYPARVIQHEYDHLLGILFIDRLDPSQRARIKDKLQDILAGRTKSFDGTQPQEQSTSAVVKRSEI